MQEISVIGLDLAKHVFQVHGVTADGAVALRRALRRGEVLKFFRALPPCLIGMEACGSVHYWGRELRWGIRLPSAPDAPRRPRFIDHQAGEARGAVAGLAHCAAGSKPYKLATVALANKMARIICKRHAVPLVSGEM